VNDRKWTRVNREATAWIKLVNSLKLRSVDPHLSALSSVQGDSLAKNREEEGGLDGGRIGYFRGGGEDDVDGRKAVGSQLACPALLKDRVTIKVGGDEEINIATSVNRVLCVGAE
jgi:hypothetical protein